MGVDAPAREAVGDDDTADAARRWWHPLAHNRVTRWLLVAAPVAVFANRAWHHRWMADDGFIYLRVVNQIRAGNGPVFNAGERVEAATSPLWTWVLAATDAVVPLRLEWIAVLTGIALTLVGIVLAIAGAATLADRRPDELWLPAGVVVLAVLAPMWNFASSGLENGLVYAWLGACLLLLARWCRGGARLSLGAAVVLGLGPLVRPELALCSLCFGGIVLGAQWGDDTWRNRCALVGAFIALPVLYQIFRMGYFASLVPTPAIAKEAGRSWWSQGLEYLGDLLGPYALWFPLLVLAVGAYLPLVLALRRARATRAQLVVGAFVAGGLLVATYVVRVGGDFMQARLLLPPLFALTAPIAVVPLRRAFLGVALLLPWAVLAFAHLRLDSDDIRAFNRGTRNPILLEDFGWGAEVTGTGTDAERQFFDGTGVYYGDQKLPAEPAPGRDPAVASYGIGVVGYGLGPDVYVLDLLGLADPVTAHLELDRRGIVAHEKPLPPPWTAARLTRPGARLDDSMFPRPQFYVAVPIDDPQGRPLAERARQARRALRCQEIADFVDDYTAPLTAGRFLANVTRAAHNHGFRIPPEPRDAVARRCD